MEIAVKLTLALEDVNAAAGPDADLICERNFKRSSAIKSGLAK
jgi:hypothetical protein